MDFFLRQSHTENEDAYFTRLGKVGSLNATNREFCDALVQARKSAGNEGLRPYHSEDAGVHCNPAQGAMAACLAMEDTGAILRLQYPILKRLDGIALLFKIVLAVLLYIAYRVS